MPMEAVQTVLASSMQAALIVGVAVFLALGVRLGMNIFVDRSAWLSERGLDEVVSRELTRPLFLTVLLIGVYVAVSLFDGPRIEFFARAGILTLLVLVWVRSGIRLVSRSLNVLQTAGRAPEFAPVMRNLWTFILLLVAFGFLLAIWGIDITPFLAGAGVAGIIIGIAAQDTIGNFFAGISLNLDRTYSVGDLLQLEDGTRGTVTEISVRSTTLLTRDNIEVTIPNSYLNSTQVINESSPVRRRRIRLDVGVAYGSDLSHVEETLMEIASETAIVLDIPEPEVRFRAFEDSAIRAQLQCFIKHPALWGRARHMLIKAVSVRFSEEEIKIPFPQRELTFFEAENEIRVGQPERTEELRDREFND